MPQVTIHTARAHRLWPAVLSKAKELIPEHEVLLLVPEQFSVSAEAEVLEGLRTDGSFHLDVTTPTHLYQRYVQLDDISEAPLEETGYHMAIAQAIDSVQDQLEFFRFSSYDISFVEQICTAITELKRGSIPPQLLLQYSSQSKEINIKAKYHDLSLIYSQYLNVMNGRFSDGEDRLSYLGGLLLKMQALTDTSVIVFGFDSLTNQMLDLLSAIAVLTSSLDIMLCYDDNRFGDGNLFASAKNSIRSFTDRLALRNIPVMRSENHEELADTDPFFTVLDHHLFSGDARQHSRTVPPDKNLPVIVRSCATPLEEAEWTARHIRALMESGCDASEICVMYPQNSLYDALIPLTLAEYGIPCFSNPKLHLRNHRLPQFIISSLRCMSGGWNRGDVLDVLHTGYTNLTLEESALLETYITANNINRGLFLKPFTRGRDAEKTAAAEEIRIKWLEPLLRCKDSLVAAKTGWESAGAVYRLIKDVGAAEKYRNTLSEMCSYGLEERYLQEMPIWENVMRVLEQLALVADQKRIPLKHIAFRLQSGLNAVSMSILPYGTSHVQTGFLGHMIQLHANHVFLCGIDGNLMKSAGAGIISDEKNDLEILSNSFLGVSRRSQECGTLLSLKNAMTLAKKGLYITWPISTDQDDSGELFPPLRHMLDTLAPEACRMPDFQDESAVSLPQLASRIRKGEAVDLSTLHLNEKEYRQLRIMLSPTRVEKSPSLAKETAIRLYQTSELSVSQLESFQSCPYSYYLRYGLHFHEKETRAVNDLDTGLFFHNAIQRFSSMLKQAAPEALAQEQIKRMASDAVLFFEDEMKKGAYGDGSFAAAQLKEAQQSVIDSAVAIWRQILGGKLHLWKTEQSFGYPGGLPPIVLVLPDGTQKMIRGRIDRIDYFERDDVRYLCVVDYKSSKKELDPEKAWEGLQLQLLLYLLACTNGQEKRKPGSAFYFWVHPAAEKAEVTLKEDAEKSIQKTFRLRGFTLNDVAVSDICDTRYLTEEQMEQSIQHAYHKAEEICEKMLSGVMMPSPVQTAQTLQCDYCSFRRDCRFSSLSETDKIRKIPNLTFEHLLEYLSEDKPAGS